jgi:hypothetical protein
VGLVVSGGVQVWNASRFDGRLSRITLLVVGYVRYDFRDDSYLLLNVL